MHTPLERFKPRCVQYETFHCVRSILVIVLAIGTTSIFCTPCLAQLGKIVDKAKKAGGDIAREGKKAGGDIAREGKKVGGDIAREGKEAAQKAGQLLEKPFRHAADNAKEAVFFGMWNHVVEKNNKLGIKGKTFGAGHPYHDLIQPHLPKGMEFDQIAFYFGAYVPSDMAGITFDRYVYIDWPYAEFTPEHLELMAHETGHVIQYNKWGTKGFARKYCDDAFGAWTKYPGYDQVKIHDAMNIEQEADDFAKRVMTAYRTTIANQQGQSGAPNTPISQSNGIPSAPQGTPEAVTPLPSQIGTNSTTMSNEELIASAIIQGVANAIQQHQQNGQGNVGNTQFPNGLDRQPRLGLKVQKVEGRGAFVMSVVAGMPGERAGIEQNDIVVAINGQRVFTADEIVNLLRDTAANGERGATVLVENHRLNHLPLNERYQNVEVSW